MGAEGFHGRVRDGIGCLAPRYGHQAGEAPFGCEVRREVSREVSGAAWACPWLEQGAWRCTRAVVRRWWLSAQLGCACRRGATSCTGQRLWIKPIRAISTGQLRGLLPFHLRPIDVVVYHGSRRDLVLRRVSRLDAFSGYPVRT